MTLSLLQPVAALTVPLGPAAADPGGCVALDDVADRLLTVAPAGGVSNGPILSGGNYGGLAWRPDGKMLATRTGTVGTVDPSTGAFTLTYDLLGGADTGQLTGVAVDPRTLETWVVASNGKLRQLDGWTGAPISAAVQLALPTGASGVGDVEVLPSGRLLFVAGHPDGDVLFTTDRSGSGTAVIGPVLLPVEGGTPTPVTGIHGLSVGAAGQLFASTRDTGIPAGSVLTVDLATGSAALHATATASSLVGLVCARPAGIQVTGTVFVDDDRDATWDEGVESIDAGRGVALSSGDSVLQRATTGDLGRYSFWTSETSGLTVTADVPPGAGVTTSAAVASTGGTVDIGYRYGTVAGTVFDDLDGDGVQEVGEAGLGSIDVTIDGVTTAGPGPHVVRTDANGAYVLDGVHAGTVTVTVPAATGSVLGSPTPAPRSVDLAAAGTVTVDVGYDGRGRVTGFVWNDLDADGAHDAGVEPYLAGVTVVADDAGAAPLTATTADDGTFTVPGVVPGDVTLSLDLDSLPVGARATRDDLVVTVPRAGVVSDRLGVQSLAVIAGRVFNDLAGDGHQETDRGFAEVEVVLDDGDTTTPVRTTRTDPTGAYAFLDLRPGTYTVTIDRTVDNGELPAVSGTEPTRTTRTVSITAEGQLHLAVHIGFALPASVTGTVFDDLDGDGRWDADAVPVERPLSGIVVDVVDGVGAVLGTGTSSTPDGVYRVDGLPHGAVTLRVRPDSFPAGVTSVPDRPVTLTAGRTTDPPEDIGIDASVDLEGRVFSDRDDSGTWSTGEPGAPGTIVQVLQEGAVVATATPASSDGSWSVRNLPRGTYDVRVATPDGAVLTTTGTAEQTVAATTAGKHTVLPVGFRYVTVGATVLADLGGDGASGPSAPLEGVTVLLADDDPTTADRSAVTDADGQVVFRELADGSFTLRLDPTTLPGSSPAPDPVAVGPVAAGTAHLDTTIHVDVRGSVAGRVFNDLDRDRSDDAEPGVEGVELVAVAVPAGGTDDGATGTAAGPPVTSRADGAWEILRLAPGRYRIDVVDGLPGGAVATTTLDQRVVDVGYGGEVTGVAIGYDLGATLSGYLFNDVDGQDGRRADEPGFPAETVTLVDAAGAIFTATTGGNGEFTFPALEQGWYDIVVREADLPHPGTVPEPVYPGRAYPVAPLTLEAASPGVADSLGRVYIAYQANAAVHLGFDAGATVQGTVFNDVDGDRTVDAREGLAGVGVELLPATGDVPLDKTTTSADGTYAFVDVVPGDVRVRLVGGTYPAATLVVGSDPRTLSPGPGEVATADFGFDAPVTLTGRVFDDLAGDGDGTGDAGLAAVRVVLSDATGGEVADETVGADGVFEFTGLAHGTWTVAVDPATVPVGANPTLPADGSASYTATYEPAALVEGLDFGFARSSVGFVVTRDEFGSDAPPVGIEGLTVVLRLAGAAEPAASGTTGAGGRIVFRDVGPGEYLIDPALPDRHIITEGVDPTPVALALGGRVEETIAIQPYAPLVTVVPGTVTELSGEAGDELAYPFRVDNDGNVADTYELAASADPAASVRIERADAPGTAVTSTGPLEPGESVDLVAIVTVPTGRDRGTVITTTLSAIGTTQDLADGVARGQTTVRSTVTMPVIAVSIEGGEPGPGYATPGATVPYAIQVTNGAPGDATTAEARDVVVTLEIGPDTAATVVPGSIVVGSTAMPDATFPLTLPSVGAGTTVAITFDVAFARPLADGTTITVTATATATGNPEGDPRSATAATSDTVSSSALPDADLTSVPPSGDAVEPGDTIVHTAVVGNRTDATDSWRDVVLVADLPDTAAVGAVTVDGAAVAAADLAAGIPLGDLEPDEYVTVTIAVTVDDPIADATVLTAVFRAAGANAGPVVWATSHTVEVRLGVDVSSDRTGTGMAATTVVHPHTVTNTGNGTTTFDLTATTDLGWTTAIVRESGVPNGTRDAGEEVVTGPVTIPPDQVPIHVLVLVDIPPGEADGATATTTLAAFSQAEPPAVAEAFAVTEAVAPDLVVDIVADPPSTVVNRGQTVTYTTTIRNEGGADATTVVVTDPTPADATYVPGSARVDGAPVGDGAGGTNPFAAGYALGTLAAGAERTVSFRATIGDVVDGTPLIDVASVTADDDRTAAGSVTQIVSASPVLDVALSSTPAPGGTITAGTEITYTATVTNRGTLAATGVSLRQAIPDRTAYVPGSTTVDGTTVADVGGTSPIVAGLSLGTLETTGSRTVRFRVRVADPVFDGEAVVAVATATSQQGVSATSATLRSIVDVRPAVSLTGGGTEEVARPGQAVYPHVVRNDGDVTDTFTLQARSSSGWRVSLVRDDDRNGTWDPTREISPVTASGPLAPGASLRFFAVVEVAADAALGSADAMTVTAQSVVDPTVSTRTTSRTRATAPSLELGMSAIPSGDRVNPGSRITYVVAVRNRGAAPATDVVVTSGTPAGTVYVPDSATRDGLRVPDGTGADGNPLASANGGLAIASITPGGEVLVTFSVAVPETATVGAQVTASATATATATATARASKVHIVAPGPALDLVLTSTPDATAATPAGTRITYTVRVRNIGQEPAEDVRVVADTPRDTSYVAGSTRRDGTRVTDGRTDPNPLSSVHGGLLIGDLGPGGAAVTLTYAVAVDDPVPTDATVEHQAMASAGDATATSELLVHSVAVTPGATVTPDVEAQAVPGGFADLAHTVTNTGDVTDAFALTAVSSLGWVTAIYTDRDGDGDIGPDDVEVASTPVLARGEGTTVVVRVTVPAGTPLDTTDVVEVTAASSLDPERTGAARDTIAVVSGALRLTKTASPLSLTPGARSTYTLTVRNVGTSPATDVVVTDATPAGTSYVPGSTRRDGSPVADVAGETALAGGLPVGTLAPGAATTVVFEVETLEDPGRTSIVNSATAAGEDTATARAGTVQPVSRDHGLDLTTAPDLTVTPGTTAVRPHLLSNTGIAPDEVTVTATSALGLPAVVHLDRDGDGILGATDPVVDGTLALAPGEQLRLLAVVHYTADVPQGSRDEVVLRARSAGDPRIQVAVADVILVSDADVSITIRATPDGDVAVGQRIAYEVTVTNRAPTDAAGVVVTFETPAGTAYIPASATLDGSPLPDAGSGDGNPLAARAGGVELGTLAAGATSVLGLVVQVSDAEPGETVAAVAGLSLDGGEPVLSNTTRAVVVDPAGLQLLKTSSPTAVSGAGEVVTWTISVMNVGSGEARDVVLHDPPAAGTRYLPGSTTVDGRPVGDGLVEESGLALGDLPAGGTRVVVFRTVLDVPGAVVQNVAAARSAGSQARPLSNVAAVTVGRILPATGAAGTRTLGGAAVLLVSGWMLLYVARPERQPVPVLRALGRRVTPTRRSSSGEDDPTHPRRTTE